MEQSWLLFILAGALGLFAAGALAALLFAGNAFISRQFAYGCSLLANAALIAGGILGLSGETLTATLFRGIFAFTDILLRINALSAFFLLVIGVVGLITTIYAIGYVSEYGRRKSIPLLHAGLPVFLLAMAGVVTAGNIFTFLVFWEIMSVVSYFLVVYEHERSEAQKAGMIYVVMTHLGTLFLTIAFFILQHYSGSFEFQQMGQTPLPKPAQSLVFIFALLGFGTKAGLVPLHVWLPRAHPSAPSHISAFMSGVMIKTAVYGFLLVTMQLLQPGPLWWGIATVIIGANTALFGVLHALGEIDQKRMLAYSSIENMGLIFMGIGTALIFLAGRQPLPASLALIAVLYHVANHALFKSLLFMGTGAILMVSHTKNMNLLGGLIRRMPWTALFMLVGSLAIAAMPPMNGFVSEWLLFQSLFTLGFSSHSIGMYLFGVLMIAVLALVGALVAFLFIRFFSMTFLALPRSDKAEQAVEAPLSMRIGMGLLTGGCIVLGILPFVLSGSVQSAAEALTGTSSALSYAITAGTISSGSSKAAVGVAGLLILSGGFVAWALTRAIGRKTVITRGETWACGGTLLPPMTYTASGFSKPIRVTFHLLLKPSRRLVADKDPQTPYFVRGYSYSSRIPLLVEDLLYKPVMSILVAGAQLFRRIQNGIVQSYLLYLLATLVIILVWAIGRQP